MLNSSLDVFSFPYTQCRIFGSRGLTFSDLQFLETITATGIRAH